MVKVFLLILLSLVVAAFGGSDVIEKKYGTIHPYFNQTSFGYFRRVKVRFFLLNLVQMLYQSKPSLCQS